MVEIDKQDVEIFKESDIVKWNVSHWTGFTKIILYKNELCLRKHFYGRNIPISNDILNSYGGFEKIKLIDVYKFCKERKWRMEHIIKELNNNEN